MGLYGKYILPKVIDWTCKQKPNRKQREKVVPHASGHVLEIGIGSGLNLPFYDEKKVKNLIGIDPSESLWKENKIETDQLSFEFNFKKAFAEDLPIDSNCIDSIVITYTLCTIPVPELAFEEFRRVLKPSGRLLFCEHGIAPDKAVRRWQNFINPMWRKFGGGCNLNRDIPKLINSNGFNIKNLDTMYIPGWKPASFNFWGEAKIN